MAGGCVAGMIGPAFAGRSFGDVALGCVIGALGAVGAGATASATLARVIAYVTGSAAAGLSGVGDAIGAELNTDPGTPNSTTDFPDWNSPDKVDPDILKKSCEQNPSAPNCQPGPTECP